MVCTEPIGRSSVTPSVALTRGANKALASGGDARWTIRTRHPVGVRGAAA